MHSGTVTVLMVVGVPGLVFVLCALIERCDAFPTMRMPPRPLSKEKPVGNPKQTS